MNSKIFRFIFAGILLLSAACTGAAELEPTQADIAYGAHPRDVLDFWKATSDKPAPLVIHIHGGGFHEGSKSAASGADIKKCLDAGVSFASINYPYYKDVPLLEIIRDHIARVVQFFRYKSADFNIDKTKVAVYGESAGAGSSLWLAFHDDIADPGSADPVLRESSRIAAAAAISPQATYNFPAWTPLFAGTLDPKAMRAWRLIMQKRVLDMYHLKSEKDFKTKDTEAMLHELDMISLIDKSDSPSYFISLETRYKDGDLLHHPRHAKALKEKCDSEGLECVLIVDETPRDQRIGVVDFLIGHLR